MNPSVVTCWKRRLSTTSFTFSACNVNNCSTLSSSFCVLLSNKMQSYALALSLQPPFSKPPHLKPSPKPRSLKLLCAESSSLLEDCRNHGFSCSFPSSCPNAVSVPSVFHSGGRFQCFVAKASSAPEASDDAAESSPGSVVGSLRLGAMFGIWYLLNIYYNIFNKQVLKVFPFPATVTAFQFGCGTVTIILMWTFRFHPRPKITASQFARILPLAIAHTMGNLLTNISLGKVAVSFTHTIKAMEPFFTVVLSALFLGERPTFWVVSSLVPIVGGVALASFTEASFNWIGFCTAMASNVTNQSRNVFSKKLMVKNEESLDNINLFSVITIISFLFLVPSAFLMEGVKLSPAYLLTAESQGVNVRELCVRALLAGICFHSYQQVSYSILQKVSPVTHAVGNSLKRVVVIVSSVIFFQTAVSPVNALGTAVALAGVFLYSRAKRISPNRKDE